MLTSAAAAVLRSLLSAFRRGRARFGRAQSTARMRKRYSLVAARREILAREVTKARRAKRKAPLKALSSVTHEMLRIELGR